MKTWICLFVAVGLSVWRGLAAEPWPAESWDESEVLSHLDGDFKNNMSGACYNPETESFWVCCNGGPSAFWELQRGGDGNWGILGRYDLGQEDLEGICQAGFNTNVVYLMVEGEDLIQEVVVLGDGRSVLRNEWNISEFVPTKGGAGSEGITFVPDAWLQREGFTDADGNPAVSRGGMGGLMFVAHQRGGRIYVFDLSADSKAVRLVGVYKTAKDESSGLEFDRSSGLLYVWHNIGSNTLEITGLSSVAEDGERRLTSVAEFQGPKGGNLEGVAMTPAASGETLCLMVDDDNQDGAALMLFRRFVLPSVRCR